MIIKIRKKTFKKCDLTNFSKVTCKGSDLPDSIGALPETYYTIKLPLEITNNMEDGVYALKCDNAWLDTRWQYLDKNIIRIAGNIETKLIQRL